MICARMLANMPKAVAWIEDVTIGLERCTIYVKIDWDLTTEENDSSYSYESAHV